MNTVKNHRATGFTTDRLVARFPWQVRTATGRLLAGCNTEAGAKRVASVINSGRAERVLVVAKGAR